MDSSRIISSDLNDTIYIWHADNGNVLQSYSGPSNGVLTTTNMKYALATNRDTTLKIWSIVKDDERYSVTHSEEITCFIVTIDSQHVITGSKDMSLKVWQTAGGKLSQVSGFPQIFTHLSKFCNKVYCFLCEDFFPKLMK